MLRRVITIACVGLLTACATKTDSEVATTTEPGARGQEAVRDTIGRDPDAIGPADTMRMAAQQIEWEASVAANPGYDVAGEASARSLDGQTRVAVEIRGAAAGAVHPWHVHAGECGSGGAIVGQPTAYPVLTASAEGTATASATIDLGLSGEADYYVNIHRSPTELGTIVACGELRQN